MQIILRMNNFNYDITHLVDTSNLEKPVEMKLTIDGQFDTGSILLKSLTRYELGEQIDLSRTLIRNSLVTIEIDNLTTQWRIMSDNVIDNLNNTYTHEIGLIDRRSELTGINLPNLSLTQESFVSNEKVRASATIYNDGSLSDARIERKSLGVVIGAVNKDGVKGYMVHSTENLVSLFAWHYFTEEARLLFAAIWLLALENRL